MFKKIYLLLILISFATGASVFCSDQAIFSQELINQKLLVMTPIANHADFIEIQNKTLKKFLKDDHEYIVFNNAFDDHEAQDIDSTCLRLGINCIRVPQEGQGTPDWMLRSNSEFVEKHPWWSSAAFRHDQAISYIMRTKGFDYNGIVVLLDSDLFLIKDFSIINFLGDYDIAGVRLGYEPDKLHFWPGCMFFRMDRLPNKQTMHFTPVMTKELTLNTGGSLYHYLQANPDVKKLFFKQKGRFLINHDYSAYFVLAAGQHEQIQCQSCREVNEKCCHIIEILQELGFSEKTLELARQQKCPGNCEFVLSDTFFHFRGISNAPNIANHDPDMDWSKLNEKFRKFNLLINDLLEV